MLSNIINLNVDLATLGGGTLSSS